LFEKLKIKGFDLILSIANIGDLFDKTIFTDKKPYSSFPVRSFQLYIEWQLSAM
jgi:hypothetical protein